MANIRSTLPSRLRQLLSGESATGGPSIKLDSEPPPQIKAFIDKVIQSPLQDIAIPLSGFRWEYTKGNFHHWRPLFHHFDTYFKTYLSCRNDLLLSDKILEDDGPFPKHAVLQILRVMQIILENCHNKSAFDCLEHFKLLLSSTDPEILIATLETLSALVKINPSKVHGSGKLIGCGSVNSYLLSLAQGWGSKEEGLGLYSCVLSNERTQEEGLSLFPSSTANERDKSQNQIGSSLYFQLHGLNTQGPEERIDDANSTSRVIYMPDLHLRKEDDLLIMKICIGEYNVPPELRFSLLTRIRYAHSFRSPRICRLYGRICLLAFIVLIQSNDANDELRTFFVNEPEYTNELIRIVRSEETIPGTIRTLAMLALGAQLAAYSTSHDRARILSGSSMSFTVGNRMILLNVLQKAVMSLKGSSDPSSLAFIDALLQFYLLHIVSSSASGSNIRGSGMVPTFLPLLEDSDPNHTHLVYLAVKALQKLMDYSSSAVSLLRELGGVELLAQRLQTEVHRVIGMSGGNDNLMVTGECSRYNDDHLYSQKRLIKVLLKALGSATYAPANSTRPQNPHDSSLPGTLSLIYGNADKFGGDIYYSAVTVMSEIIHKDPTCLPALLELGLPDSFLSSVLSGVLPSSKAITCVPNGIGAICLNAKGLEAVKETSALRFLVDIFTSKKYVLVMNEAVVPLANATEELLRHVSSLRSSGVDMIIEIVNKIASFGESSSLSGSSSSEKVNGTTAMETDSEDKGNEQHCRLGGVVDSVTEDISDEQFLQLCILHLMVLLHRTTENAETCRLFVEKCGIEALLKLLLRPSIVQSSEGMSIALQSTMVFKGFTQHHSALLARAFCSSLREHLKKALMAFGAASGSFLLDPKLMPDDGIFSPLFLVEFLLFLAASKDNRWVSALLAELGNGSKDVLEDIGIVHREILWQIALLEDAKVGTEDDSASSSFAEPESQQLESSASDTDGQRLNSFRQFLDPLLRRRIPGWNIESQFFDLINLYRELGRATGFQQRLGIDGSNMRFGANHSTLSDAPGSADKKEYDKRRSYHTSCCDMVRSLSFHIIHLFQELGKVMVLPSRRRDDTVNASPASKSVASSFASIALGHMNHGGHVNSSGSEASISTKCRYFGKVIDFINSILLNRPDSCNAIMLNCLYGRGVVQSVLTTFEATGQLLFAVNRAPASPMDTDSGNIKQDEKEDGDHAWIYGPLASYGKFMDHLVTSSFILSPFTKHLLVQTLASGDVPFPRDAETFVKVLQSMVLKAVLPVWTHPQFTDCSSEFITTVISIIGHIYSGVEVNIASSNSAHVIGPPPNETAVATIVEMGFSRSRAEEALRQVGSNSVELAMEWLFSHPEEIQEDDELARALAMSLGNSDTETNVDASNDSSKELEEEMVQLPPVEELLSTCTKLLQMKEPLAFPVRDLLVLICSQNAGQYRSSVISFILDQVRDSSSISDSRNNSLLSGLLHVLALILHEDVGAREIASKSGLVKVVTDLLSGWDSGSVDKEKHQVPKWVTTAFLALDRLLQVEQKLNTEIVEQLKGDNVSSQQTSVSIDEDNKSKLQSSFGSPRHIDIHEQKRLIEIACSCIKSQFPSETMHAVLQLCSTLTRTHSVAVCFLDGGGVSSLLSLPTSSLFPGFDNVAATIIRHVLEDPQTLQQAMEAEIKHSLAALANRHSSGRVTPRIFIINLNSVISRDPVIFMQAVKSVCQVEMVGDRPYIVLVKDREKDKPKEKEKEKTSDKDRTQQTDGKGNLCNTNSAAPGTGHGKLTDSNSKSVKMHRKCPPSFVNVIELLLDSVNVFVPPLTNEVRTDVPVDAPSSTDMEIDVAAVKGKGKAIATVSDLNGVSGQDASSSIAKIAFILKLLTEILLMYASSVHVLLRRDGEISSCRVPNQRGSAGLSTSGIFHHILHRFIPYSRNSKKERKSDGDWRHKLATRASQFLVASCVRSAEARKRVFTEINCIFNDFVDSSDGFKPPSSNMQSFFDLLNDILVARTSTGSCISAEASATFIDVGLVASLTRMLEVLDLDHSESPKVVTGIVKTLELVTKEHAHSADSSAIKGESSVKPAEHNQSGRVDNIDASQSMEMASQSSHDTVAADRVESFNTVQNYGGPQAVTDDVEHDQDFDGGFAPATEDHYMQETPEDARDLDNGVDNVGIHFEIQPHEQENLDDDEDEEMSGDDGDEVDEDDDEDDEDHNDLEADDVHHLPHPDTDQDDHEIDDEFDDEVLEEDEEDGGDDEGGVILRLEEGMNGMDVFDQIDVFGRDHSFASETLRVMPVEVFGSRRQGRTTSIYSLLGRSGENSAPSRHPLLLGPPSQRSASPRQSENAHIMIRSDRNSDSASSQLDTIFRSLRNGRHSHPLNLWVDESQQGSGSSAAIIPQGLEELLVSQLRRSVPEKSSDHNTSMVEPQTHGDSIQLQESGAGVRSENPVENNVNNENADVPPSSAANGSSLNVDGNHMVNDSLQGTVASNRHSQSIEMQFEQNDATVRDVEAVSQESSGSGATLGESLRSLDVEIGSADGHDDGGERQGSSDRTLDPQAARARRTNLSSGNSTAVGVRDAPLLSVTEVSENSSREADQDVPAAEQQINSVAGSGSIDPAFLDALPEELRAEVLSAQQGQVAQPSNVEQQNSGDIDPEFLAALPPDIRAEVLAQQQAQRNHQSQELEGQPVEMDTVSIIATFPSDLREEVLLTSSDAILANLTPALVAEANMLRERFAHRYHNRNLFGMYPRNRRGESSRRGEGIGSSLERIGGSIVSRRSVSAKVIEAEGTPLVGTGALQAMVRLLRIVQPLYKGALQKLLLNLCAHNETRTALVKILMDMLMLDTRKPINYSNSVESPYRLYGCQNNVMYSRPQRFDGIPPLVCRRVLETLTYLARNHPYVAKILLQFRLPLATLQEPRNIDQSRGKALMTEEQQEGFISVALLLSLLNQPLYLRSIAHLEQLLNLLDVIIDHAERKPSSSDKLRASPTELASTTEQIPASQISMSDAAINAENRYAPSEVAESSLKTADSSKPSASCASNECDVQSVLTNLPRAELRLLCSLLAREGLSDNAYGLVAEVMKKLVAIAPRHSHLFISELAGAIQHPIKSSMDELHKFGEAVKALLCTTSSDGAAILRVLQALSSLVSSISEKEKEMQLLPETERSSALGQVSDINAALEPLWIELSSCISKIESYSDSAPDLSAPSRTSTSRQSGVTSPLPAGAQNILPYIESFFLVCENLHPAPPGSGHDLGMAAISDVEDASTSSGQLKTSGPITKFDEKHVVFVKFSEKHRKLLNAFIRQNPGLLDKSFSLLLKVPRFVDFDNKRAHFRSKIKHQHDHQHSPLRISVRRAYILEDSYNQLRMRSTQDLKGRLTVHFQGEEGIDAGGLTREWYQLLSRVIFDKGALLFTTVGNESTFQPNPNSVYQTEHLSYFKFVGRVVGKALFDGQLLDVHFTRSFYKHILGVKVTYHDIEAIDPDYFKNLKWMLKNDISDVLDLTFSIDADEEKLILYERTQVTDYELIPGGRNIKVTEENKHQYVDLVAEHRLTTAIRPQINAFLEGFNELIPRELITIFNDKELELLISGLPDIDLDDMRANTEYAGYSAASPVIQWFWDVVQGFSKEDKARLLQFVTGTSKVPLEGFSALQGISGSQKFQIHKAYGSADHLPSAHTCFNQLDLPEYPSKEHLEERLLLAIHEGSEGFGFG